MSFSLPPAVRLAERLSATIEAAVDGSGFKRKHRYTFGARLRMQAWDVLSTANRAARRPEKRAALLDDLKDQVDDIKLALQQGKLLHAFSSHGQFESLYLIADQLGAQVGGWHKQNHPQGQNAQARAHGQRANTLSTRGASIYEANL